MKGLMGKLATQIDMNILRPCYTFFTMVLCTLSPLLLIMVSVLWKRILIPLLFCWNLNLGISFFEVSILDLLMSFMDSAPMPLEGSVAPSSPGSSQMAAQVDPCSTSVVPADEESKGSDSSSSSEDSLKVHDGSADGRADASQGPPLRGSSLPPRRTRILPVTKNWTLSTEVNSTFGMGKSVRLSMMP